MDKIVSAEHNELKHSAAKWWLVLALLFSLFSTAGFEVSLSGQKYVTKTEQVVSASKVSKRTHSLKRTAPFASDITSLPDLIQKQLTCAARAYSKHILVKEQCALRVSRLISKPVYHFKLPLNPRSLDEDHFNFLIG